jgi:integrase
MEDDDNIEMISADDLLDAVREKELEEYRKPIRDLKNQHPIKEGQKPLDWLHDTVTKKFEQPKKELSFSFKDTNPAPNPSLQSSSRTAAQNEPAIVHHPKTGKNIGSRRVLKQSGLLSVKKEDYLKSKKIERRDIRDETIKVYGEAVDTFIAFVGDVDVRKVGKGTVRKFREDFTKVPPNASKLDQYSGMSIPEIIAKVGDDDSQWKSIGRVRNILMRLSSFFNWLVENDDIEKNPFSKMIPHDADAGSSTYEPFTTDDLRKIFSGPIYENRRFKKHFYFWAPLLGIYTGARREELAQLALDDIKEVDGVLVFDINDTGNKRVKNKSSIRTIPVHSTLLKIGIVDYISISKKRGRKRFLWELPKLERGYGRYIGDRFNARLKSLSIKSPTKTFHSTRGTFIEALISAEVPEATTNFLTGHTNPSMSYGYYGRGDSVKMRQDAIEKVQYDIPFINELLKGGKPLSWSKF